jgi:hypothetical protein
MECTAGVFAIAAQLSRRPFRGLRFAGFYFGVRLLGLFIHIGLINLPVLLFFVGRVNPWKHYKGMGRPPPPSDFPPVPPWLQAMPLTMKAVTGNSKVFQKIAGFTLAHRGYGKHGRYKAQL